MAATTTLAADFFGRRPSAAAAGLQTPGEPGRNAGAPPAVLRLPAHVVPKSVDTHTFTPSPAPLSHQFHRPLYCCPANCVHCTLCMCSGPTPCTADRYWRHVGHHWTQKYVCTLHLARATAILARMAAFAAKSASGASMVAAVTLSVAAVQSGARPCAKKEQPF